MNSEVTRIALFRFFFVFSAFDIYTVHVGLNTVLNTGYFLYDVHVSK